MHFILAWRNIWRNPRRTTVILIAVIIGVWSMVFLSAFARGMLREMVNNTVSLLTGHLQIHAKGFHDDPVIDYILAGEQREQALAVIQEHLPEDGSYSSRLRLNMVLNNARHNGGATVVGIEPDREPGVSFFKPETITEGRYLEPGDTNKIVIGKALAEDFDTHTGNKLILMSQDSTGEIASKAFRICGIYQSTLESTEKAYVFVPIDAMRKMLQIPSAVTEYVVMLPDETEATAFAQAIRANLASGAKASGGGAAQTKNASSDAGAGGSTDAVYEVMTWRQMTPFLDAYLEVFDTYLYMWHVIVFVAMAFGLVNTMLMAVYERIREFGLIKALGMKPGRIIKGVVTESAILLLIGIVAGNLIAIATVLVLGHTGIDLSAMAQGSEQFNLSRIVYPVLTPKDMIGANALVLVLGVIISLYPAIKAARFTPVEALTHTG